MAIVRFTDRELDLMGVLWEQGPSTVAQGNELAERCHQALTAREAVIWDLRICEGLEYEEIGDQLGCSAAAARGVLHRGRQRLIEMGVVEPPSC